MRLPQLLDPADCCDRLFRILRENRKDAYVVWVCLSELKRLVRRWGHNTEQKRTLMTEIIEHHMDDATIVLWTIAFLSGENIGDPVAFLVRQRGVEFLNVVLDRHRRSEKIMTATFSQLTILKFLTTANDFHAILVGSGCLDRLMTVIEFYRYNRGIVPSGHHLLRSVVQSEPGRSAFVKARGFDWLLRVSVDNECFNNRMVSNVVRSITAIDELETLKDKIESKGGSFWLLLSAKAHVCNEFMWVDWRNAIRQVLRKELDATSSASIGRTTHQKLPMSLSCVLESLQEEEVEVELDDSFLSNNKSTNRK